MSTLPSSVRGRVRRAAVDLVSFEITPGVITGAYLLLGIGALVLSDFVFPALFAEPLLSQSQTVKGGLEVVVTGGIIYVLARRGHRQIASSRDRIQRQREELAVLHRVMRHNLRNDMNVIQGRADLVEEADDDEDLTADCEEIKRKVEETLGYADKTSRIRRVGEVGGTTIDLTTRMAEMVAEHPLNDESVEVDLDLPPDCRVRVNKLFTEAVSELLTNAIEHTKARPVEISIRASRDLDRRGFISLEIKDNGPGIKAEDSRVINEGQEGQLLHLDGLGLWFANWTVVESDGEMWLEPGTGGGTTVRLVVPAA